MCNIIMYVSGIITHVTAVLTWPCIIEWFDSVCDSPEFSCLHVHLCCVYGNEREDFGTSWYNSFRNMLIYCLTNWRSVSEYHRSRRTAVMPPWRTRK